MPRLAAIEWDAREARIVLARTRGRDVVVDEMFTVDVADPADDKTTPVMLGERIGAALAARGAGRVETLVAVGRASIELQEMSLPPAPPEELPEMVRFQAMRQFTTISDDWPLDFVPLASQDDGEGQRVLAAAIAPDLVRQIRETCAAGELSPKRLILRPFAAASLLCRQEHGTHQPPRLMVDMLTDEADLTVLVDEQVILVRTVRLPASAAAAAQIRALAGQIQRTIAAAQNQLRGRPIEKVVVCGDGGEQAAVLESLEEKLTQEVVLFDPLSTVNLGTALREQRPDHPGRFTPLLGMLLDEADETRHGIDFLNPRHRPKPPSTKRRNALIGGVAAAALVSVVGITWLQLADLDTGIAALRAKSKELEKPVVDATKLQRDVAEVEAFLESDITWLDEMLGLARNLPPPSDVVITQMRMETRRPAGGQVVLDGFVREFSQLSEMQAALRSGGRRVISAGHQEDERRDKYRWDFNETVLIEPREIDE